MVEFRNVANFDAVWLPQWRRGEVRAYRAKKSKKKCVPTTFLKTAVALSHSSPISEPINQGWNPMLFE